MIITNLKIIEDFKAEHSNIRSRLDAWVQEVKDATWKSPSDVKKRYPKASILSQNQIIFNIGDNFRLLVKINYIFNNIFIEKIDKHSDYDRWKKR